MMYGKKFKAAQLARHSYLRDVMDARHHGQNGHKPEPGVSSETVARRREAQAMREEREHTKEAWE